MSKTVKNIGIVIKSANPSAVKLGCELAEWVAGRGCGVYADAERSDAVSPAKVVPAAELAALVDVMVVLGGDGTMLYAAGVVAGRKVPILGVNLGGLGFLTAISVREVYPLLERVLSGEFKTEERMLLCVELERDGSQVASYTVLNDAVVKGVSARLLRLETRINKEYVTTYRADGLIVATPTGSTAYALSAAGPILYPTIHSIIVVPVCPFNLTNRPVVIPDWMTVEVTVTGAASGVQLVMDGLVETPMVDGDKMTVRRAETSVYLIRQEGRSYFDILRERLMWEVKPGS